MIFFCKTAKENNSDSILVAHHKLDNIETYLIQKKRNVITDYYGLKKSQIYYYNNQKFWILRPLLKIDKEEIHQYLIINKIKYCIDESNFEDIYLRNRIRKTINENVYFKYNQAIIQDNKKLLSLDYSKLITNNKINYQLWSKLNFINQQRIIYNYLKINKNQLIYKKSKFTYELAKKLNNDQKKESIFWLDKEFCFVKHNNELFIDKTNIFQRKSIKNIINNNLLWLSKKRYIINTINDSNKWLVTNETILLKNLKITNDISFYKIWKKRKKDIYLDYDPIFVYNNKIIYINPVLISTFSFKYQNLIKSYITNNLKKFEMEPVQLLITNK